MIRRLIFGVILIQVPQNDQNPEFVREAFREIAPRYVLANHVLSAGVDVLWRRRVARMVAAMGPNEVLDVATGTGDLAMAVEEACPTANVTAVDFCEAMLDEARKRGLENLMVADAMDLPFDDASFDAVTVGYGLRNMESWAGAAREMARVIRPEGVLVVLDFSLPRSAILRSAYRLYLHQILPVVGGALTGKRRAYQYLGESIERFPSGCAMEELLVEAGFSSVTSMGLSGGISSIYQAFR